jgi:hypothetical protein
MSHNSFHQLLSFLRHKLVVDNQMGSLRGGAILPELSLMHACGIWPVGRIPMISSFYWHIRFVTLSCYMEMAASKLSMRVMSWLLNFQQQLMKSKKLQGDLN